jgi:hypothetical protein
VSAGRWYVRPLLNAAIEPAVGPLEAASSRKSQSAGGTSPTCTSNLDRELLTAAKARTTMEAGSSPIPIRRAPAVLIVNDRLLY